MSAIKQSKIAEAELNFTPRRSMRSTKLDMSFKETDLRMSLAHPDGTKRTPRRRTKQTSSDEDYELKKGSPAQHPKTEPEQSGSEHSSGEKSKALKKKNKKSRKQKAKANQKRKEAKKLAKSSISDEELAANGESLENPDSMANEDSVGNEDSAGNEDLVVNPESVRNEDLVEKEDLVTNEGLLKNNESIENDVVVKSESLLNGEHLVEDEELVESGFVSANSKEVLSSFQSPDFAKNNQQEIINLVSPDLSIKPKEENVTKSSEVGDAVAESVDESVIIPAEKEDVANDTFEMSQTEIKIEKVISHEIKSPIETSRPTDCAGNTPRGPRHSSTPARKSVLDRKCTPFKPINEKSLKRVMSLTVASPTPKKIAAIVFSSPSVTPISRNELTKTPLKSALRTSRRSMSVDAVDLNATSKKGVVFNSPANTTINIDEVDWLMKSKKKAPAKEIPGSEKKAKENVTVRKRRSMSLVETASEKKLLKKMVANAEDANSSKKQKRDPTPTSRVKLPNFNAIHKHQFERMESITDHVARKVERAKVLSASKAKSDTVTSSFNGKETPNSLKKDLKRLNNAAKPIQPKARQKIELSSIKVTKDAANTTQRPVLTENANKTVGVVRPVRKMEVKKTVSDTPNRHATQNATEKLKERRKEHMTMFKQSNKINSDTTILHEERKERKEYIAGVRANRRFILQMQHRDKLRQESVE